MPTSRALTLEHRDRLVRAVSGTDGPRSAVLEHRRAQVRRTSRVLLLAGATAVVGGLATAPQLEAGTPPAAAEQR